MEIPKIHGDRIEARGKFFNADSRARLSHRLTARQTRFFYGTIVLLTTSVGQRSVKRKEKYGRGPARGITEVMIEPWKMRFRGVTGTMIAWFTGENGYVAMNMRLDRADKELGIRFSFPCNRASLFNSPSFRYILPDISNRWISIKGRKITMKFLSSLCVCEIILTFWKKLKIGETTL